MSSRPSCASAAWSSAAWVRSQRRCARWSGRRLATSAQKPGPWPNTRRCASSWTATVSRTSGGASTSRHENNRRRAREALPHRLRVSRTVTRAGVTPRAGACRAIAASSASRARTRSHASSTARSGRRSVAASVTEQLVLLLAADPFHTRAAAARRTGDDAHAVRRPAITEERAVAHRPGSGEPVRHGRLAGEMPSQPGLALGEERLHQPTGPRLRDPRPGDRGDHPATRVDRHPEATGPVRPPERVLEVPAGQGRAGGSLDRGVAAVRAVGFHRTDRATGAGARPGGPAQAAARRSRCVRAVGARPIPCYTPPPDEWGYSSAGRASEWHSEGPGFEPP